MEKNKEKGKACKINDKNKVNKMIQEKKRNKRKKKESYEIQKKIKPK